MKKNTLVVLIALAIGLTGCATGNQAIMKETPQTISSKLKKGITTKADVEKLFGPANGTGMEMGHEVWTYYGSNHSALALLLPIPLPGSHQSGALQIEFDNRGRVYQYNFGNASN